jgi:hypothetical protein
MKEYLIHKQKMSQFTEANTGAIETEIVNLQRVMKQKDLRRYKRFLFTMYGKTKIYVSIREFVWNHIVHPYLAEATCEKFYEFLTTKEESESVTVNILDLTVPYPVRPIKTTLTLPLGCDFGDLIYLNVVEQSYDDSYDSKLTKDKIDRIIIRHPEDTSPLKSLYRVEFYKTTLGDLGFTNGTKVVLYPPIMIDNASKSK